MNYKAFFADRNNLQGEHFSCSFSYNGGPTALTGNDTYPVLFVLTGSLTMFRDGVEHLFPAGEMVLVDRNCFTNGFCLPETIVLEYALPQALTSRFNTFDAPATPPIPITGRLATWVEQRLLGQRRLTISEDEELIDMLVRYQSRRIKMVYEVMKCYIEEKNGPRRRKRHLDNQEKRI